MNPQLLQLLSAAFVIGLLFYIRQSLPGGGDGGGAAAGVGALRAPLSSLYARPGGGGGGVAPPAAGGTGGPLLFPASYQCTREQSALQVARLVPFESACPGSEWWPRLYLAGMACRDLTLVDIGANKGYKLATWAGVFRPELDLFPDTLFRKFVDVYGDFEDMGGSCQDFEDARLPQLVARACEERGGGGPPRAATSFKLALHAFEPLPGNAGVLRRVVEPWVNEKGGGTATLTVHQLAAVGDRSISQVEFGACLAGNERCGVKTKGYDGGDVYSKGNVVTAITVDAWFAEQGLDRVDVLAIDAEGHDPEVIKGADETLRRQGARIVEFEYHMLRNWADSKVEDVVNKLDGYGYDCFFLQKYNTVIRITGCWDPRYEFHDWSNVMCVLRNEVAMVEALNSMTPIVTGQLESPNENNRKGSLLSMIANREKEKAKKDEAKAVG